MSGYLLDTNVVSEVRKGPRANPRVLRWLETVEDDRLFLSVLVLGEIRKGVEQARLQDLANVSALEQWLNGLEQRYAADHILPVTTAIADQWGRLAAIRPISAVDALLAATALVHNLVFVTRNVQHVAHTAVKVLNPFES